MPKRLFKQIVVSIISFLFLFVIGFGMVKLIMPKPKPFDFRQAQISQLETLQYSSDAFWVSQNNRFFIYNRLANPNDNWGAQDFDFYFDFIIIEDDQEKIINSISNTDYILPRQTKYVLIIVDNLNFQFDKINFRIDSKTINWQEPFSQELLDPNIFSITNVALRTGSGEIATATPTNNTLVYEFKRDLKRGDSGEDVFNLQSVLAQDSAVYPEGIINGNFDLATYKAVIRFQKVANIVPQTGIVDYKTREILNKLFGGSKPTTTSLSGFSFSNDLKFGDRGSEVSELQRVLANDPSVYPEARINGNFDYLLKRAIERFQEKYSLRITGEFDTPTRTKLNSLLNTSSTQDNIASGLTAELAFTVFNNSNFSFRDVMLVGFLCDAQNRVTAVSRNTIELLSQKNQNVNFSWVHKMEGDLKVCPNGLQAYTNIFDINNIIN